MKKIVLLTTGLFFLYSYVNAQSPNKTMAIGASNPNPNAVLHVESPS